MQLSMIEFARNVLKIKKASSTEFDKNCIPVVGLLNEWKRGNVLMKGTATNIGGTMRLGSYKANLKINSLVKSIYKSNSINERHRHRYEVNLQYRMNLKKKGLFFLACRPIMNCQKLLNLKSPMVYWRSISS